MTTCLALGVQIPACVIISDKPWPRDLAAETGDVKVINHPLLHRHSQELSAQLAR
jgi:hypothetical protein